MANNGKRRTTTNQIAIAQRHGVAQSTVSKINKLLTQFLLEKENEETTTATITKTNQQQKQIERLATMLHDKPRGGDREVRARRRKLGSNYGDIAKYILELLDDRCTRYLSEYCDAVRRRFNISVAVSTMHQFIAQFDITRKRTVRLLPRQAFTKKNIAWRKDFIQEWFTAGSFNIDSIATKQEFDDQQNWRLKLSSSTNTNKKKKRNNKQQQQQQQRNIFSNKQIFFIDETGVCRHTLRRMFGRSKRGTEARVRHGSFNTSRGANHSTIIAIGAASRWVEAVLETPRGTRKLAPLGTTALPIVPACLATHSSIWWWTTHQFTKVILILNGDQSFWINLLAQKTNAHTI